MPDIFDRDSYKKWLYNQPRDVAIALSTRAALRVLPLIATDEYPSQNEIVTQLTFHAFRASFISLTTVAHPAIATGPAPREAAQTDISFAKGSPFEVTQSALTVANATHTAGYAAYAALAAHLSAAGAQDIGLEQKIWAALMEDVTQVENEATAISVAERPLWAIETPPAEIIARHASLNKYLEEDQCDWRFWANWYADCLNGAPKNWAQMQEISEISSEDWAKGADFVNPVLSGLVTIDEAYADIHTPADPDLLRLTLTRVDDAMDDVLCGKGGIKERSLECVILRRLQTKYAGDTQRVEMDLSLIHRSLTRQLESGELPDLPEIHALAEICGTGALDLRAANPELAKTRKARKSQAAKERPPLKLIKGGQNVVPHKAVTPEASKMTATRSTQSVPLPEGAAPIVATAPKREPDPAAAADETQQKPTGLLGRLGIGLSRQGAVGE